MATWLYQLSEGYWSLKNYRVDIWEGERWTWRVNQIRRPQSSPDHPEPGDIIFFFYAKTGAKESGFCGWAVALSWVEEELDGEKVKRVYFRPVFPSDQMKMNPWGDPTALELADRARGTVPNATLFFVDAELALDISAGIRLWASGVNRP